MVGLTYAGLLSGRKCSNYSSYSYSHKMVLGSYHESHGLPLPNLKPEINIEPLLIFLFTIDKRTNTVIKLINSKLFKIF